MMVTVEKRQKKNEGEEGWTQRSWLALGLTWLLWLLSGLPDSLVSLERVNFYPQMHHLCCFERKYFAVLQPCGVNFFQCAIVSVLAPLAT